MPTERLSMRRIRQVLQLHFDEALEQRLFPAPSNKPGARRHPEPDWALLVREMKRPGVSLLILWEEYDAVHPEGRASVVS